MTYNSTLTKVFVYLLISIEAIYQTSVPLEIQNRKNVHLATSDCLVIACYLWGVLHFSETLKAKHQLDRKKKEAIAQFWKSDDPEPMPNAVAHTEYQNPELRKQKEETEKHSAGFGDLLKGWFKK